MTFLKNYFREITLFIKDEQKMDMWDYIVYGLMLLSITLYIRNTRPLVCFLKFNKAMAIQLSRYIITILLSSTLLFNLYKLIKDN